MLYIIKRKELAFRNTKSEEMFVVLAKLTFSSVENFNSSIVNEYFVSLDRFVFNCIWCCLVKLYNAFVQIVGLV